VLCDLEEIDDADKPGLPCELRRDIGEGDLEDLCHENLAGRERVPATDRHVWSLPQPDGSGDFAPTNAIAERSDELHGRVPEGSFISRERAESTMLALRSLEGRWGNSPDDGLNRDAQPEQLAVVPGQRIELEPDR
jgi:hypothetical protein